MPDTEQKSFQRQAACKARVSDIVSMRLDELNVSRVNILATIVHKPDKNENYGDAVIDDGTGRIQLRSFENKDLISKIEVGDSALVIGKVREFNGEKYIVPEILRKIDNPAWISIRKIELSRNEPAAAEIKDEPKEISEISDIYDEVCSIIKKLDDGSGVFIDDIIKNCSKPEAESTINELLKKGNIFEIRPGRVKVLE